MLIQNLANRNLDCVSRATRNHRFEPKLLSRYRGRCALPNRSTEGLLVSVSLSTIQGVSTEPKRFNLRWLYSYCRLPPVIYALEATLEPHRSGNRKDRARVLSGRRRQYIRIAFSRLETITTGLSSPLRSDCLITYAPLHLGVPFTQRDFIELVPELYLNSSQTDSLAETTSDNLFIFLRLCTFLHRLAVVLGRWCNADRFDFGEVEWTLSIDST